MKTFIPSSVFLVCFLALIAGGTAQAADQPFLPGSERMTEQRQRFPFDSVWVKPGVKRTDYDSIQIAWVNTSYLLENTGWKAANPGNANLEEAAQSLARYTEQTFINAFSAAKNKGLPLTAQRGPRTLVLELAIVELVPSKAALGAVGLVAPFAGAAAVGVGSKVAGGRPSVGIQGRVRNSQTGEILMMFADHEEAQIRPIDPKAATWWGHAESIIADWARQCVELANTPPTHQVKDRASFTLLPW